MNRPMIDRSLKTLFFAFLLAVTSCATNRVDLPDYVPLQRPSGKTYMQAPLIVAPFEDDRFQLYTYTTTTMRDTLGYGVGTGTIYTPKNIPDHVSRALVSQFQAYGMNVTYDPRIRCRIRGSSDHPRILLSGPSSRQGLVLCGSILDYQFELDHQRITLGFITTLNMASGAALAAQVSLHLYLVKGRTGRILWSGIPASADEKKEAIHPPNLERQAVTYLEETLSRALDKAARDLSNAREE